MRSLGSVLVALLVLTAGCTGAPNSDKTETKNPTTHSPTTNLTTQSTPALADTQTRESVRDFVQKYERVYKWNEILRPTSTNINLVVTNTTVRNATRSGFVVHVEMSITHYYEPRDSSKTMIVSDRYLASYFVNETTVRRVASERKSTTTLDPRNGTVVKSETNR